MADLARQADPRVDLWWGELTAFVDSVRSQPVRDLMKRVLANPEIAERLRSFPAARSIHHAYAGGMLEHVVSIAQVMDALAKIYPYLNRDLLLFGALFHDIGKLWELDVSEGIHYTRRGRLVGHMEIACALIDEHREHVPHFTEELRDILKHIVLSHHGRYEYGSPKRPKFLEAYLVAHVDEMDSRLNSIRRFMEQESAEGSDWTRYSDMYDRYFYLGVMRNKDLDFD
jgi:3'-5' exoribonuclease